jgi:hypothetical protein
VEIDCYDAKSYLQDDNGTAVFFRCAVVILQPEQVRELWHGCTPNCCCYNNWPLVDGVSCGACAERKSPKKAGCRPPVG